jgi:hypothetical protein
VSIAAPGPDASPPGLRRRLLARICARLGGWCELLRGAHAARVPF